MSCFALANGDAGKAYEYYWNMPLKNLWYLLWAYYNFNGIKVKPIERDSEAILDGN